LQAKIAGRCEAEPLGKLRRDGRERGWCGSGRRGRARFGAARPPRCVGGKLGGDASRGWQTGCGDGGGGVGR
jgi:hypothetical protein